MEKGKMKLIPVTINYQKHENIEKIVQCTVQYHAKLLQIPQNICDFILTELLVN